MRVIILSASTGGGHMRASLALKSHILNNDCNAVVEIVDTLKYISPILNKTVTEGYEYLAKKTPKIYGVMYNTTNKSNILNSFVMAINNQFSKKLMPLLETFKPDIIITTHPFSTEMVSNLKGLGKISVPILCIMTDYAPHRTWINKNIDGYIVSNEEMVEEMVTMGIQREKIYPFGIPIEDAFYTEKDKTQVFKELNLNQSIPTILLMAGSFGVTNVLKIYNSIVNIDLDFQIIVITGRNKKLYESFKRAINNQYRHKMSARLARQKNMFLKRCGIKYERSGKKETRLIFFTNEVYKYMKIADLIITKPGGLTISEALACNLPMAIFNAIPGQEEENAEFLIDNNMAVRIGKGQECSRTVRELLEQREKLDRMKDSCRSFNKSLSNKNIFELINKFIKENN